jgi:diguanylate cyclase (GGDEF)-like protein
MTSPLDTTTLLSQLRLATMRLTIVNTLATHILTQPEPAATLQLITEHARALLPFDSVQLVIAGRRDRPWSVVPPSPVVVGRDLAAVSSRTMAPPVWLAGGLVADCLNRGVLLVLADVPASGRALAPLEAEAIRDGARALVLAPLVADGEALGALLFWAKRPGAFDREAVHTVQLLTPHVANALAVARLVERTRVLALVDPLTGLANRRQFEERLEREAGWATRYRYDLSLCLFAVDHFQRVGDEQGHAPGDEVLRRVADLFQTRVRANDLACRFGGEEFALILPETPAGAAWRLAERLRQDAAAGAIGAHADGSPITLSVGVASSPAHGTGPAALLGAADAALAQARLAGGDRVATAAHQPLDLPLVT